MTIDVTEVLSRDDTTTVPRAGEVNPLSVAIYIHDLSPGGVERQCLVLARELQARGVDITLVVHKVRGELVPLLPKGLPVVSLNGRRTLDDILHLRRFLLDERPNVLLANVDHNNIAAVLAKAIAGTPTKVIICQHNPLTAGYHATVNWKHRFVPLAYRLLRRRIDHAIAVSAGIADELRHNGGLPDDKISVIHNAVIGDDFLSRSRQPVHHRWFQNHDQPVFVNAGRLVEMKDHRTLLRGFAKLRQQRPARLMILGTGPMHAELQALADQLGIADHVDLVGFVENPLPYMRAADAFVLSSRSEGFGNVLVEAMGCGTRIVSTNCPHGPADILQGGRYGLLVPPRDPDALAGGLNEVLEADKKFPAAMLRQRAEAFSYRACADNYRELFDKLA
jgi:glycosyltransferase involved in cell wall biosynthesis